MLFNLPTLINRYFALLTGFFLLGSSYGFATIRLPDDFSGFRLGMAEKEVKLALSGKGFDTWIDADHQKIDGRDSSAADIQKLIAARERTAKTLPCMVTQTSSEVTPPIPMVEKIVCAFTDREEGPLKMLFLSLYADHLFLIETRFRSSLSRDAYTGLVGKFGPHFETDDYDDRLPNMTSDVPEKQACARALCKVVFWGGKKDPTQVLALLKNAEAASREALFLRMLDLPTNEKAAKALQSYDENSPKQAAKKLGF